jgi:hypothetical protein
MTVPTIPVAPTTAIFIPILTFPKRRNLFIIVFKFHLKPLSFYKGRKKALITLRSSLFSLQLCVKH